MKEVKRIDLGLVSYREAWDYQEALLKKVIEHKLLFRDGKTNTPSLNYLIFCEHPHVYTLGKSGSESHLLRSQQQLKQKGVDFYKINRGGDVTYHGPGQVVGYPIFDLDQFFTDIHKYLRYIEESVICVLKEYQIEGDRLENYTGVWLDPNSPTQARKICAIGVRCSRWVTMHGFALNVNTDLSYFNDIIPCGISDKQVTSMSRETGQNISIEDLKNKLFWQLQKQFEFKPYEERY